MARRTGPRQHIEYYERGAPEIVPAILCILAPYASAPAADSSFLSVNLQSAPMRYTLTLATALLLVSLAAFHAAEQTLPSPHDYQVVQRKGILTLDARLSEGVAGPATVETRFEITPVP